MGDVVSTGRRRFLTAGAALLGAAAMPRMALALPTRGERKLSFYNTHTGEWLKTVYWADGHYLPESLAQVNKLLRDFRTGEIKPIDKALLDQLVRVRALTEADGKPFHIISGYRSPKTNTMLHAHSSAVATKSLHQLGKAIDIRIPGVDLDRLRKAALSMQAGGVGYYPDPQFVHMDTGRVRFW